MIVTSPDEMPVELLDALRSPVARVRSHGGDVEVRYDDERHELHIRLTGVCTSCPALPVTFGAAFWDPMKRLECVDEVRLDNVRIGERTLLRIASSFRDS